MRGPGAGLPDLPSLRTRLRITSQSSSENLLHGKQCVVTERLICAKLQQAHHCDTWCASHRPRCVQSSHEILTALHFVDLT